MSLPEKGNQWRRNLGDLTLVLETLVNNKENYPTSSPLQKQLVDTCGYCIGLNTVKLNIQVSPQVQ